MHFNNWFGFTIGNVARVFSSLSVVKFLKNEHVNTSVATVNNYIDAGVDAYFYIPVRKFNIEGKKLLKTQEKIYTVGSSNTLEVDFIAEKVVKHQMEKLYT